MRFFLLSFAILLLAPSSLRAAEMYFGSNGTSFNIGSLIEVGVLLSTEGQSVAAVEGEIVFLTPDLELIEVLDGDSAINFWLERPVAGAGSVRFAGVTPGGFVRSDAHLFTLVFEAKQLTERAVIDALDTQVLLNDGLGTAASLTISPLTLEILQDGSLSSYQTPIDTTPPEEFNIVLAQDADVHAGAWTAVFATQDKGVGLGHYEILESRRWWQPRGWFTSSDWVVAESPYLLRDQSLTSKISVKAIDKAGNERLSTLSSSQDFFIKADMKKWGILAAILLMTVVTIIIAFGKLWRKRGGGIRS
jgi:hypothetical protein